MELMPTRRGCVHFGALALCLLMAVVGVGISLWSGVETRELWRLEGRNVPHPSTAEVKAERKKLQWRVEEARAARRSCLEAIGYFCQGFLRVDGVVAALALCAALTTPGRPRFLRFADWRGFPDLRRAAWLDFGLAMAAFLLFAAGEQVALALRPDLSHPAVLPPDGEAATRLIAREFARMTPAARSVQIVVGISILLFGLIACRIASRLWEGLRAERRRRQAESNARTVGQF